LGKASVVSKCGDQRDTGRRTVFGKKGGEIGKRDKKKGDQIRGFLHLQSTCAKEGNKGLAGPTNVGMEEEGTRLEEEPAKKKKGVGKKV